MSKFRIIKDDDVEKAIETIPHPETVLMTSLDNPMTNKNDINTNVKLIRFSSGDECYIKSLWYERYDVFKQPIIFREFINYNRWIYPLLNKQSLRFSENVDTEKELGAFLDEVYFYDMTDLLTDSIIQDISDNSGLTKAIMKIKKHITKYDKKKDHCFSQQKTKIEEEINSFRNEWQNYLELLARKYQNEKYKQLSCNLILQTIRTTDYLNLCVINMRYRNLVYEFCDFFEEFVVKHDHEKFINFKLNLSLRLPDSVQTAMDIGSNITSIIKNMSGSTIDKDAILGRISELNTLKDLMM